MDNPKKPNFKHKNHKGNYKKNYGSLQEGHGLAYLQKNAVKKRYLLEKKKEEIKIKGKDESNDTNADDDPYAKYEDSREVFDEMPCKKPKLSKLNRAKQEYENKIKEKERKKKEREEKLKEIEEKKRKYKEMKMERDKVFSQKTKKGQPLMRGRMELLLENVESLLAREKVKS